MTDNELIKIFLPLLKQGIFSPPYTQAPYNFDPSQMVVQQNYQPTQQGVPTQPGIYFFQIIPGRAYGFPKREDVWDPNQQIMVHIEWQWYEAPFQFMALSVQNPANTSQITPLDMVRVAQQVIHSDRMRVALNNLGIGIYRTIDIRPALFMDDYERFENGPSFDVTFTYKNVVTTSSDVVESINLNNGVYPVL